MSQAVLTRKAIEGAADAVAGGESLRSAARRLGVTHVALAKRLKRHAELSKGFGEFDETDVRIILAVAKAGIPGALTEQARYMECSLLDLLEVCKAFRVAYKDDDPGEGDPDQDEDEDDLG
jgi:hypothetical protein